MAKFASMLTTMGTAIIGFIGEVVGALFGAEGVWADLLPFFLIGVIVSLVLLGVKVISRCVWGR